ncbi:MAG: di-heme oxidoredictase family protein [Pseudomonadota bacterium]
MNNRRGGRQAPVSQNLSEAPTGYDNLTNGYLEQGPDYATLNADTVVALRSFNDNRFIFEEVETVADGIGPVYNAQSCRECHENVVTGGASQVAEHRTGRLDGDEFFESLGGSLVHSRATHADIVEHVYYEDTIRTFRLSTSTLGDGYIEALSNDTLLRLRAAQPAAMRGIAVLTPVLEAPGTTRIGRFGWKSQHGSLVSFSADAYLNEMGITSPLLPEENTSSGMPVGYGTAYDPVQDPEDDGDDVIAFADFMRSTKAPPRGEITDTVLAGAAVFKRIGCETCHTESLATAAPGTPINGGTFVIPEALGNKVIHPYSDFLLHDVGTGDGIPVQPTPEFAHTANAMRTAPLWGLQTRNRLMHDGLTFTRQEAIQRHQGQASTVTRRYNALSPEEQALLLEFLDSL